MSKAKGFIIGAIFVISVLNGLAVCDLSSSTDVQDKGKLETLQFQKAHIAQVYPDQQKLIEINLQGISKYITHQNEEKVMGNFLLQYKSVVRSAKIYLSIFVNSDNQKSNDTIKHNFTLFDHSQFQELTVFNLNFLSQFKFNTINKILICVNADQFSVISLALLNNQLPFEVDLSAQGNGSQSSFGLIPVWIPFSYDTQTEKVRHIIKYINFRAGENVKKLRISRVKGHPKIFLYNCQTDRIEFCKDQIKDEHVEGTLMFQKQIQISLSKQPHCKDCLILLGFKNLGAETQIEITQHSAHQTVVISKDQPIFYDLKRNSSLEIISYYSLNIQPDRNPLFLDFSFVDANASSIKLEDISLSQLKNFKETLLSSKDFVLENRANAIRIKLSQNLRISPQTDKNQKNKQIWYKVSVRITSKTHSYFSIVDRNIPFGEENFISLKDGQIFHSYIFDDITSEHDSQRVKALFEVQNFKLKVASISTLTIMASCKQFNQLQIQFYSDPSKATRVSPKVYVENITNHNKKCSQLIHLNPKILFGQGKNNRDSGKQQATAVNEEGQWAYIKLTGVKDQVDLLYSSSDIIFLENNFPYHSQLQYDQALFFYIPYVKNQAIIKISKCSDCQLSVSYSEEQIADLKAKRSQQILTTQLKSIHNILAYQMKGKHGLYIKLKTNNYAHFVISVEDEMISKDSRILKPEETLNKISFSLEDDNKLVLEFPPPQFIYTNNLNSPTHFSLIEGSIQVQVSREAYCPEFIFTEKQKTRDVSISQIVPELTHDETGNEIMRYAMELKHHDFFGIRAQKGSQIFSYEVVNIESMKEFAEYRLSIFNVVLFLTFAVFMSFVCFMGLKRKRVRKIGGEVVLEQTDGEETSMIRLN